MDQGTQFLLALVMEWGALLHYLLNGVFMLDINLMHFFEMGSNFIYHSSFFFSILRKVYISSNFSIRILSPSCTYWPFSRNISLFTLKSSKTFNLLATAFYIIKNLLLIPPFGKLSRSVNLLFLTPAPWFSPPGHYFIIEDVSICELVFPPDKLL